ncbi:phage holin family protein [Ralstonia pseudosolanacearum]|uniref:phage holin family protein n=1 Tax=Ralstonia pseudosolanacearum TaxID=1310165 RepID=UPI00035B1D50|nr:phage holin family protein [Ralstonia pseudosolanacearum]AXV94440.1 phage holin family protein [Ralstonia solanacearum]ESS50174.1 phage-related transmembrane protein [Ralstonia solanacearum SD54]MCK4149926.1 phage holin family protein [Ralstonia pseudosolanacearum]NKB15091.1 phage holin family protein [Ralstonia solanacearum]QKL90937.1 phage holin family protein [Ralstonia solanacearum]
MNALFIVQAVLCALIALRLLLFKRDGAAHRPWASRLAYALIVLAGAVPIGVLFGRYDWALMAQNGITAVLCLAVFSVRGNVVELFRMGGGADASWLVRLLRRSV